MNFYEILGFVVWSTVVVFMLLSIRDEKDVR